MSVEPRVSVIMAVYNGEKYLREAVDGVLAQTLTDFELIIVNDASTDQTAAILASYHDRRVRVFHNERNLKPAASRNGAIGAARGKYVAILDADDIALPRRLERQTEWLDGNPGIDVTGTFAVPIDEAGREVELDYCTPPTSEIDIKWALLFHNVFVHSSVMMRRTAVQRAGGYTEDPILAAAFVEDYDLLSRISRFGHVNNLGEPLVKYRVHSNGASVRIAAEQRRQADEIARRNVAWVLGCDAIDPQIWAAFRRFLYTPPAQRVDMERAEARRAINFLCDLHHAFCCKYGFSGIQADRHRKQVFWPWARHALALSYRRNGRRSLRCRTFLLESATRLVLRALLARPRADSETAVALG
jgi:glycosyltransferase involved in cell wall biosynthesis